MLPANNIVLSCVLLTAVLIPNCGAQQYCNIREVWSGTCDITCSRIGAGVSTDEPGKVVAQFLVDVFPDFQSLCRDMWMLSISDCEFPDNTITTNWLDIEGDLPPIGSLVIQRSGFLNKIEPGAFSSSPALGTSLRTLALYYNRELRSMEAGLTEGLTKLTSFNWVGNHQLERADSEVLFPFANTIESMHIGDCGMAAAEVVANLTGACQTIGSLPTLKTIDFGFNPGTGFSILSNVHLNKLNSIMSLYLWNSEIEKLDNITVFDQIAPSIQYIDLSNNRLTTMKNGTFDSIMSYNKQRVNINLGGNPWRCDCHLEWLQVVMRYALGGIVVNDQPRCSSPASQAGTLLIEADLTADCPTLEPEEPWELVCRDKHITA